MQMQQSASELLALLLLLVVATYAQQASELFVIHVYDKFYCTGQVSLLLQSLLTLQSMGQQISHVLLLQV